MPPCTAPTIASSPTPSRQSEGAYKGIANVNDEMSEKELAALDKGGICGCRFAFLKRLGGVGDMTKFQRIVHRVAELGWHIDVYFEPGTIAEFAPILSALPTRYVIDHMGTVQAGKGLDDPGFTALLDLQKNDEKCWVKITGLERALRGRKAIPRRGAVREGADRQCARSGHLGHRLAASQRQDHAE